MLGHSRRKAACASLSIDPRLALNSSIYSLQARAAYTAEQTEMAVLSDFLTARAFFRARAEGNGQAARKGDTVKRISRLTFYLLFSLSLREPRENFFPALCWKDRSILRFVPLFLLPYFFC